MNRRRRIYEGKAKILYEGPEPGTLIQFFKDDATAFNKKKHEVIDGKGVLNNRISEYIFSHLNKIGIPTHFIRRLNMKGTPQFPQCGFSGQVVQILDYIGVDYKGVNVLADSEIRQGIKEYSNWPTIPQLYVKGEFVGGCDIVREMFQAGELQQHLQENGITVRGAA